LVWKIKRMLNVGSERRLSQAVEAVHHFAMDVIRSGDGRLATASGAPCKQDLLSRFMALGKPGQADLPERTPIAPKNFFETPSSVSSWPAETPPRLH
jgi:hypothetical protein